MSYKKNKIRAWINLAGTVAAIVAVFLPEGSARITVLAVAVVCVGLGRR